MKVAIITANTDIYRERKENESGEIIRDMVTEAGLEIVFMRALPTDRKVLSTVMQRMVDNHLTDMILDNRRSRMQCRGLHAGGDKRRDRQRGSGDWRSNADSYDAAD